MRLRVLISSLSILLLWSGCHSLTAPLASSAKTEWPGKQADGSVLLPNSWSLRPAGRQIELGDFPVNLAVHPGGRFAAILHAGHGPHGIFVVDLTREQVISQTPVEETFYGLEFSRDGSQLFCSGASQEVIHRFRFTQGQLSEHKEIKMREVKAIGVPAGMALDKAAKKIWVANLLGQRVSAIEVEQNVVTDISLGANSTNVGQIIIPSANPDVAAITKRAQAGESGTNHEGPYPYACRLDEKRRRLYVSLWGEASVAVIDLNSNQMIARWPTEEHPNEMLLSASGEILYVANANRNTVSVFDTSNGKALETICAALYPNWPSGSTPNSLALTPDEKILFVANADNNNLAVFDVSARGKSHALGFIPVGWYPTSVRVTPDGQHLLVANGKGIISKPNPGGPQPGKKDPRKTLPQYIAELFRGTLTVIDLPSRKHFEKELINYTAQAYRCSPLKADASVSAIRPSDNPIPLQPGDPSPIKYVVYIVKENRTYDQVLGDLRQGNGDPKLCLFPESISPNHHQLAREFVLLDNFYVDAEVSADGHEWSMAAYATDFVEKLWPLQYGHDQRGKYIYPAEGIFPIATPAGGYLWERAKAAGVSYRSYGEFVGNPKIWNGPVAARVKSLQGHIDEWYRGFDIHYSDQKRADRFISELKRFESEDEMPRLQIIRLPNDHTSGAVRGQHTPRAFVADNDLALGRVVEALSRSKFWPQMAIFVVEDDAQNGPDHVDAHRTIAFAISPFIKHGTVDSTMYSTSGMLRTMELILGLKPMSQFDAAATPMFNSFQATADLRPYHTLPARVNLEERNLKKSWGEAASRKMDFSKEDAADDLVLNEIIWRSVRGANSPMPPPTRAGFVFVHAKKDDD